MFLRIGRVLIAVGTTLSASAGLAQQSTPPLLTSMPQEWVFPLAGSQPSCGCSSFNRSNALTETNVIASKGAFGEDPKATLRVRVSGKDVEVKRTSHKKVSRDTFVSSFSNKEVRITFRESQVDYGKYCAAYEDPPTHGSCFIGRLSATQSKVSQSVPIITVCGC